MPTSSSNKTNTVSDIAARHGVSPEAAQQVLASLQAGGGRQAQFNHRDLGGMGQWSQGGMIMIGDMFNQNLKARVSALCDDLAHYVHNQPSEPAQTQSHDKSSGQRGASGWPAELGNPASSGAQNDMRYAYFPETHRLAIEQNGDLRVYDSGEHRISGFAQAQGGDQTLTFTSQSGAVRLDDLKLVSSSGDKSRRAAV